MPMTTAYDVVEKSYDTFRLEDVLLKLSLLILVLDKCIGSFTEVLYEKNI